MASTVYFFFMMFLVKGCDSITLRTLGVPSYAVKGSDVVLECDYDLEGQALYSVKWYKNGLEFYRYIPGNSNPMTYYVRPGVKVDKTQSDERKVTLRRLTIESTGRYRCEVSTEAPSFATVSAYNDMFVVVLPKDGPKITGGKDRYSVGDTVNVNCTSKASKPAADIQWIINGKAAPNDTLREYDLVNETPYQHEELKKLYSVTVGLKFVVKPSHFQKDILDSSGIRQSGSHPRGLKLKCIASISSVYWKSNEKSAESTKHRRTASHMYIAKDDGSSERYLGDSVSDSQSGYIDYGGGAETCFQKQCLFASLIWIVIAMNVV